MPTNEELKSEVKALADTLGTVTREVGRKVDQHTATLADARLRLATIDTRLGAVDTRLFTVDERLNGMDTKLDQVGEKLDQVLVALTRIEENIKQ